MYIHVVIMCFCLRNYALKLLCFVSYPLQKYLYEATNWGKKINIFMKLEWSWETRVDIFRFFKSHWFLMMNAISIINRQILLSIFIFFKESRTL